MSCCLFHDWHLCRKHVPVRIIGGLLRPTSCTATLPSGEVTCRSSNARNTTLCSFNSLLVCTDCAEAIQCGFFLVLELELLLGIAFGLLGVARALCSIRCRHLPDLPIGPGPSHLSRPFGCVCPHFALTTWEKSRLFTLLVK